MATTGLQVAGLASNFDWKSFLDQVMNLEHVPADRLSNEKANNSLKVTQLGTLGTRLTALQTSAAALKADGLFGRRNATSATPSSTWTSAAAVGTATGDYQIAVTNLAKAASLSGAADIGTALNAASDDVSGLTLANLPVGQAVTAGTFTINGQKVTIALTDSLQDVFDAISTATGGDVTASYDHTTDKITLTSATTDVMLGAANDTSNFLRALKLGNNGTDTVTSSDRLGAVKTTATLASANLAAAITNIDGSGDSTFAINGVSISYNVNTDTLSAVLKRINDSTAGVNATYDSANDRVVLANKSTGDLGIALSETGAGLLGALGLTSGATLNRGENAEFTVNGGNTFTSLSNTLDETAHGIVGLSITARSEETQTITVGTDTTAIRSAIDEFISDFNDVQTFLDSVTKVTTDSKGKVTAAVLAGNREIQEWGKNLRSMAFAAISGLGGSVDRIDDLGIDFKPGTSELQIKDTAKLTAALSAATGDVEDFFQTSTTGLAAKFETFLDQITDQNSAQQTALNKANTALDDQIATIERQLEQRRAVMEAAFIEMENAQSRIKQQQSAVDGLWAQINSAKK